MLKGRVRFAGINSVVEATATLAHGITPSSFYLTIAPQEIRARDVIGDLVMSDGSNTVTFRDCKIDLGSLERNSQGQVIQLELIDRRWTWAWGAMQGWYNARKPPEIGTIKAATQKTPEELAKLCLEELDETGYDTSGLASADDYPEVDWDGPAPAQALAELAERYNCHVVLRLDGTISIAKVGEGMGLPGDFVMDASASIDLPEAPSSLAILCGKTRFQTDLELEAVGLERNGSIQLVDRLSYRPAAGWGWADFPYLVCVLSDRDRELAKKSVFRWYRVKTPVSVCGLPFQISDLDYLELETEQVDTITVNNVTSNKPADLWGTWFRGNDNLQNAVGGVAPPIGAGTNLADAGYYRNFTIDTDNKIVIFDDLVFKSGNNGPPLVFVPAQLKLRTAIHCRDEDGKWQRYSRTRTLSSRSSTPARSLRHNEIILSMVNGTARNQADVDRECEYYFDAAEAEYRVSTPERHRYIGLRQISPDGAIRQVTWHVGPDGCWTQASRNDEHERFTIPYRERRLIEQMRQMASEFKVGYNRKGVLHLQRRKPGAIGLGPGAD